VGGKLEKEGQRSVVTNISLRGGERSSRNGDPLFDGAILRGGVMRNTEGEGEKNIFNFI